MMDILCVMQIVMQIQVIEGSAKHKLLINLLRIENVLKSGLIYAIPIMLLIGVFILAIGHNTARLKKVAIVWFFILLPLLYVGAIYVLAGIYTAVLFYMK